MQPPRDAPGHPMRLQAGFSPAQGNSPPLLSSLLLKLQRKEFATIPKALLIITFMALLWNSLLSHRDGIIIYNNPK